MYLLGIWPACLLLAGCVGTVHEEERQARRDFREVSAAYRPDGAKPILPTVRSDGALSSFLIYGTLNNPTIEVAYYNWQASIERITLSRSLPDPKITFEAGIADALTSVMPGLMLDFPGAGKLSAMAAIGSAESRAMFHAFRKEVISSAATIKRAYYRLQAATDSVGVITRALALLQDLEDTARVQHEAGKVTLQDVLRAQIEKERLSTEVENLKDALGAARANFKGALGVDPSAQFPTPETFENSTGVISPEGLMAQALERNPTLRELRSEIQGAEAAIRLARLGVAPDFGVGLEADLKSSPIMLTPQLWFSLPVWKDKIAAQIAAAQAEASAARAKLSSEQIRLAVEFAAATYMLSETRRNLDLVVNRLIPKAAQSLEVARSGYVGAKSSFIDVLEAERTLIDFEKSRIEAREQHENALATLSLIIAGSTPEGASFMDFNLEEDQ